MAQPKFTLQTFDIEVEVSLKKIDYKELSKDLLPTYVPTLDEKDVILKREQTLAFKYYDPEGNDVTERKPEFQWWRRVQKSGLSIKLTRKRENAHQPAENEAKPSASSRKSLTAC